jgi:hypothetical protein
VALVSALVDITLGTLAAVGDLPSSHGLNWQSTSNRVARWGTGGQAPDRLAPARHLRATAPARSRARADARVPAALSVAGVCCGEGDRRTVLLVVSGGRFIHLG